MQQEGTGPAPGERATELEVDASTISGKDVGGGYQGVADMAETGPTAVIELHI